MPESIRKIGNMAMTLYYKGFRPSNGPLKLEHFIDLCLAADAKLKQDEYEKERLLQIRRTKNANPDIQLSADNYETVEVSIKKDQVRLPNPVMMFTGDKGTIGINRIAPVGRCGGSFMRINPDQVWQVCEIKNVVFWYPEGQCIKFLNIDNVCSGVEKLSVTYVPELGVKGSVQETRRMAILNMVTMFIKAALDNVLIDTTNDQNANADRQTEINKAILRALQNR